MLDVVQVVLQLLHGVFDASPVGVADLRPAGESGLDDVALTIERDRPRQFAHERRTLGTRSDKAHLALQYVPELRQLVDPRPAKNPADGGHARVVRMGPYRA